MRTFATTCSFHFRCLLLLILVVQSTLSAPHRTSVAKPGCPSQCGNLTIPYPFGIGFSCSMAFGYTLTCDASTDPPKTFIPIPITDTKTQVFHISASEIRIINRVTFSCFNLQGDEVLNRTEMIAFTDISPYSFSASANKFTVIGCDVLGIIVGLQGLGAACGSLCAKQEDVIGGYCSAIGCCQALIPKGLNAVGFTFSYPLNHSNVIGFNPCVYAFLAEEDKFVFQGASDLVDPNFANRTTKNVPIVLDWSISNETCSQAKQNLTSYACQGNTTCSDSDSGKGGYHCYCLPGYEGNPYLTPGCTGSYHLSTCCTQVYYQHSDYFTIILVYVCVFIMVQLYCHCQILMNVQNKMKISAQRTAKTLQEVTYVPVLLSILVMVL